MIQYALYFAYGCFGLALLFYLFRVVFAPGLADRVLALDTMAINMIALLTLFGMDRGTAMYFEATLLFAWSASSRPWLMRSSSFAATSSNRGARHDPGKSSSRRFWSSAASSGLSAHTGWSSCPTR